MTPLPARHTLPPGLVSLADHEQHARTQLDDNAWAYFSGGADFRRFCFSGFDTLTTSSCSPWITAQPS